MNNEVKSLIGEYNRSKNKIKARLKDFEGLHKAEDDIIFTELCFCLLTPQSRAVKCDEAIKDLAGSGLLFKGNAGKICRKIKGRARFHNKKAVYIVGARKIFKSGGRLTVKDTVDLSDPFEAREWLVKNIKGLGYKEASHFLRNVGLGRGMAILDRHILKNFIACGVIDRIPSSLGSRKVYLGIEAKIHDFSNSVGIPMEELDLLFWSKETGYIFK